MEVDILNSAAQGLFALFEPTRLMFLFLGVVVGLVLGVIPGLGGLVGLSLLLPLTFAMDTYTAIAFMMGLLSVTATSDSIPAVLFGVPGTVASAATVLDGYPMARQGEADRALGAAFAASVMGGVFGAILLAMMIPVLRPAILAIAKPEMLAITIFGISLAASLSGRSQTKGLIVACVGLIIAAVGQDRASEMRWTFDTIYLYNGFHIIPITLGLFALPEIADLVIQRSAIIKQGITAKITIFGQVRGILDAVRNWFLVLRCSLIGSGLGAVPGIGAPVIDWVAYGHAMRTMKGAQESFGKGDVRGVIASESSNNAKEGGSLVPTIAFGIPGSASMALILAFLLTHGITPGPAMLTTNLDVTYTLVWSVALANVFGVVICILLANQIARIATVRIALLAPIVLVIIYLGAFQGKNDWGDLYTLLGFGVIGFIMKRLGWPRPPLILGVVLGSLLEANAFISAQVYGWGWMARPIAATILIVTLIGICAPLIRAAIRASRERGQYSRRIKVSTAALDMRQLAFGLLVAAFFAYVYASTIGWAFRSYLMPRAVSIVALVLTAMFLLSLFMRVETIDRNGALVARREGTDMDLTSDFAGIRARVFWKRLLAFCAWAVAFLIVALVIGLLPACLVFLLGYLRFQERESWATTLGVTAVVMVAIYGLFHIILNVPWAPSVVGNMFPGLRSTLLFGFM